MNMDSVSIDRTPTGGRRPCELIAALYDLTYGVPPEIYALPSSGGDRRYFRLSSPSRESVIGVWSGNLRENKAFVELAGRFRGCGVRVPEILASDLEAGVCIQEDLGDVSLLSLLGGEGRIPLSGECLRSLARMQTLPASEWDDCVMNAPFSRRQVMWDLNYFKYEFLKTTGIEFDEERLEDDFETLAEILMSTPDSMNGFMYRDFQSRNVMVKGGVPYFIDFQAGRRGPLVYDAVSFLWQARAGFPDSERRLLLRIYAAELAKYRDVKEDVVLNEVEKMSLFRTLQVLGAYGFRGLVEKRSQFIISIPGAIANLRDMLGGEVLGLMPELRRVASELSESRYAAGPHSGRLKVQVFSFSYKKGYPEDLTGNGGGFMFDCRGMHNPGRYDEYKPLTGLDRPVIDFLESAGEVSGFVEKAVEIVSPVVKRYIDRGFSNLQVGFGCTGGRHRSVYCAEHFASSIAGMYPEAEVRIIHREQGMERVVEEKV